MPDAGANVAIADALVLHHRLVDQLVTDGVITGAAVETAFRAVPRHPFLPDEPLERVYQDAPIVTKRGSDGVPISSSSQPAAMAMMLEQLGVQPGDRILEIGAGTGYNAALLARLAGRDGHVVSIDIDEDLVAAARDRLAVAAVPRSAPVQVVQADGGLGWSEAATYDRIILTVGAWDLAPAWIEQLAPEGRLLVPLWLRGAQRTVAFVRDGERLRSVSITACAFMRLRGVFAGPEGFVTVGNAEDAITVTSDDRTSLDPGGIGPLLASPAVEHPTDIALDWGRAAWSGLGLWLALRDSRFCSLFAEHPTTAMPSIAAKFQWTVGLMTPTSLALLTSPGDQAGANQARLGVRQYGPDGALASALLRHVRAWDRAGRPDDDGLRIEASPLDAVEATPPEATVVAKRWHRFVILWS